MYDRQRMKTAVETNMVCRAYSAAAAAPTAAATIDTKPKTKWAKKKKKKKQKNFVLIRIHRFDTNCRMYFYFIFCAYWSQCIHRRRKKNYCSLWSMVVPLFRHTHASKHSILALSTATATFALNSLLSAETMKHYIHTNKLNIRFESINCWLACIWDAIRVNRKTTVVRV